MSIVHLNEFGKTLFEVIHLEFRGRIFSRV
jgi:hypothetical protein